LGLVDEAIEAARGLDDPFVLGEVLNAKTGSLLLTGRTPEARIVSEESLALSAKLPASRLTAQTRDLAALIVWFEQGDAAARPLIDAVVAELRSFGADGLANWFTVMGTTSLIPRDNPDLAIQRLREMIERIRPGEMLSAWTTANAAMTLMLDLSKRADPGDLEEATRFARTYQKAASGGTTHRYFGAVAQIAVQSGRPRDAARLAGFADSLRAAIGVGSFFLAAGAADETWALIVATLPEDEATALRDEGARMSRDEALKLAAGEA
jgi:hypothetical protein